MAQAGFTPISLYFSTTASAVPTAGNLANGELGLNIADMKLYAKNSSGVVTLLASSSATTAVNTISFGSTGLTPATATSGAVTVAGTLAVANGGTGQTSYTDGQLLIGNSSGNTLSKSTLTAGTGVTITNAGGSITIAATGTGGTVTSVAVSGGTTGLTTSGGPITGSGTITLAGTLGVANGGTGLTTLTANNVILGNGTSAPSFVAPSTAGNVLTSNGTTWTSAAGGGGGAQGFVTQYQGPSAAPTFNSFSIALI
jgi:hypothetical protein